MSESKKTTAEKIKIMQAYLNGETLEASTVDLSSWVEWRFHEEPVWNWEHCDYRIWEEDHTLDDIPWELIQEKWKWAVMDGKGVVWLTEEKPRDPSYTTWVIEGRVSKLPLKIRTPNARYWDKTLTKRPEGV